MKKLFREVLVASKAAAILLIALGVLLLVGSLIYFFSAKKFDATIIRFEEFSADGMVLERPVFQYESHEGEVEVSSVGTIPKKYKIGHNVEIFLFLDKAIISNVRSVVIFPLIFIVLGVVFLVTIMKIEAVLRRRQTDVVRDWKEESHTGGAA